MNYGKNQRALLDFLYKHPNRWHRIKRRKAIDAAKRLANRSIGVYLTNIIEDGCPPHVYFTMPQMLIEQN